MARFSASRRRDTLQALVLCGALLAAPAASHAVDKPGIRTRYDASATFAVVRERLVARRVLERLALVLAPIRLDRELSLRAAECGARALPYDADNGVITLCYETIRSIEDRVRNAKLDAAEAHDVVTGAVAAEALHGVALGLMRAFDVPVWGREHDAADRLAAFVMLKFDQRTATVSIIGAARLFLLAARSAPKVDHAAALSPELQRYFNFLCIAYGGERAGFSRVVDEGLLPQSRAERCAREYDQVRKAFDLRVMPRIDPDLLVEVRATDWLADAKQ